MATTRAMRRIVSPELSTRSGACAYFHFVRPIRSLYLVFLAAVGIEQAINVSVDDFTDILMTRSLKLVRRRKVLRI